MAEKRKAKYTGKQNVKTPAASRTMKQRWSNFIDKYFTHIFIVGAILFFILLLAVKIGFFYFEGLASLALLILGVWFLWRFHDALFPLNFEFKEGSVWLYTGIYALFGWFFDSAGNALYNKPLELLCPAASKLTREVVSIDTTDGVELVQAFECVSRIDGSVVEIGWYWLAGVRLLEYLVLGFLLIAVFRIGLYWKNGK